MRLLSTAFFVAFLLAPTVALACTSDGFVIDDVWPAEDAVVKTNVQPFIGLSGGRFGGFDPLNESDHSVLLSEVGTGQYVTVQTQWLGSMLGLPNGGVGLVRPVGALSPGEYLLEVETSGGTMNRTFEVSSEAMGAAPSAPQVEWSTVRFTDPFPVDCEEVRHANILKITGGAGGDASPHWYRVQFEEFEDGSGRKFVGAIAPDASGDAVYRTYLDFTPECIGVYPVTVHGVEGDATVDCMPTACAEMTADDLTVNAPSEIDPDSVPVCTAWPPDAMMEGGDDAGGGDADMPDTDMSAAGDPDAGGSAASIGGDTGEEGCSTSRGSPCGHLPLLLLIGWLAVRRRFTRS